MRALPILATLLLAAPMAANAASELDLLQSRCAEQERQIRQLEEENSRLKSLVAGSAQTAPAESPKTSQKSPSKTTGTESASTASKAPKGSGGTHTVKQGETFYSIAKRYGIGPEALQDANPGVKATALRPGMSLRLGSGPIVAKSETPSKTKESPSSEKKSAPARKETTAKNSPVADKPVVATREAAPSPKLSNTPQPVSTQEPVEIAKSRPRVHLIPIDEEISFGAFAQAHGTSTEKLNALNGQNLNSSTVLAKGSELRVPAQP